MRCGSTTQIQRWCAFFVFFLKKYFDLKDEEISSLGKSYLNAYSKHSKKKRTNRLPYGTVRVTVSRTRVIQSIYGSIQEYAGFDREAWLD
jgi:hypothetical protein